MSTDIRKIEAMIREIRACFNRLKLLGDELHQDLGITTAMRSVMEALYEGGKQTVPQVARSKRVTRQHIQVLVNDLVEAAFVITRANPTDKRSPLVALTKQGRAIFDRMRQREKVVLAEMSRALAGSDLDSGLAVLGTLRVYLDSKLQKGESDE